MPKINYDKISKILNIRFSNAKSVDSDIKGNVVIDYDKSGEVVSVDIMPISLEEFSRIQANIYEAFGKTVISKAR